MLISAIVKGANRMYKLLIELLKDITIEERINIIEMLYYEGGSSCILDMIRASFSID